MKYFLIKPKPALCLLKFASLGLLVVKLATGLSGQVLFTGSYTQNFSALGTGTVSWTQNSTLPGWTVTAQASESSFTASTGSSTGGAVYNFGASSGADRALGYLGSSSNAWTNFYLQLQNNTGAALTSLTISYNGELWRSAGAQPTASNNTLAFYYATGSPTLVDSASTTGWTAVAALNYAPTVTQSAGAQAGLQTAVSVTLTGLSVANGSSIYFRWAGADGTGTDAGIGIDDVSISAIPEPAVYATAFGLLVMIGAAVKRRRTHRASALSPRAI